MASRQKKRDGWSAGEADKYIIRMRILFAWAYFLASLAVLIVGSLFLPTFDFSWEGSEFHFQPFVVFALWLEYHAYRLMRTVEAL